MIRHIIVIPNFLESAFKTLEDLIHETEEVAETVVEDVGKTIGKLFKRCHKKPAPKAIQVHDVFDIGGMFKAFQMELHNDTILDKLLDITQVMSIIPDDDIEYYLPKPDASNLVDKRDKVMADILLLTIINVFSYNDNDSLMP